jgi:phospholipid/cholesterol/gamma-HCH transport system ATP-binding protein
MSIQVKNLSKSFGQTPILADISYDMDPGKVNMIIGKSGSGKSVMLKCIVGLLEPDIGEVLYDGRSFLHAEFQVKREIRKQIGMLFQASALFDSLTVEENVAFPIRMFTRQTSAEIKQRVAFCLERVNLNKVEKLLPSEISGGMKKRVGIARAIALQPRYLFCDEPNSGLDPLTASVIDKLIYEITHEYNMTTVVVSHDMNSVTNIGDKIMFLNEGKKAWEGSKQELMTTSEERVREFVFVSDFMKQKIVV